ncbi:MAG: hypothetical protein QMC95_09235 [Desulfitobacteriaceae bacterium]|nr:hypothetical protein [Desulfitobacteriaceae bacterium]MDI6914392.1 hypothetical protein [Desulfitobacteriaceae bacterium]
MDKYPIANLSQDELQHIKSLEQELNQKHSLTEKVLIAYTKK